MIYIYFLNTFGNIEALGGHDNCWHKTQPFGAAYKR